MALGEQDGASIPEGGYGRAISGGARTDDYAQGIYFHQWLMHEGILKTCFVIGPSNNSICSLLFNRMNRDISSIVQWIERFGEKQGKDSGM
ncbi:hypothetical protein OH491_26945 [Termitidicoccus mucosus]|uniref:hypothetical protein n=1 Tax=Termitidicoccus mucosus TaxID=1184151 RepID=UPI00318408F2